MLSSACVVQLLIHSLFAMSNSILSRISSSKACTFNDTVAYPHIHTTHPELSFEQSAQTQYSYVVTYNVYIICAKWRKERCELNGGRHVSRTNRARRTFAMRSRVHVRTCICVNIINVNKLVNIYAFSYAHTHTHKYATRICLRRRCSLHYVMLYEYVCFCTILCMYGKITNARAGVKRTLHAHNTRLMWVRWRKLASTALAAIPDRDAEWKIEKDRYEEESAHECDYICYSIGYDFAQRLHACWLSGHDCHINRRQTPVLDLCMTITVSVLHLCAVGSGS